jgi:hypothetical protein
MTPAVIETVLAGFNVDRVLREAITGDLMEERAQLAAVHGERSADRWVMQQMLRSVPAFVQASVRSGGFQLVITVVGAALAALLAISLLIGASVVLFTTLFSAETMARITIVAFAADLAYGAVGGYLAARLGRGAPLGAAFLFGVLGVSLALVTAGDVPGWYRAALVMLLVPATLTGGWMRARHLARRPYPG